MKTIINHLEIGEKETILIFDAINNYWERAYSELTNGVSTDSEKEYWENTKTMSGELIKYLHGFLIKN